MLLKDAEISFICNQVRNFELCEIVFSIQWLKLRIYYFLFFPEYKLDFEKLRIRNSSVSKEFFQTRRRVHWGYVSLVKIFLQPKVLSNSIKKCHIWQSKTFKRFWNFRFLSKQKDTSEKRTIFAKDLCFVSIRYSWNFKHCVFPFL